MDIKDFILIAGGMLIAAVITHGFWIAWRSKKEPLRLDIVPDLLPNQAPQASDELARFRGELPNGGSRIVPPAQGDLLRDTRVPVLLEPNVAAASHSLTAGAQAQTRNSEQTGSEQTELARNDVQQKAALQPPTPPSSTQPSAQEAAQRALGRDNDPVPATIAASASKRQHVDVANASRAAAERELFGTGIDSAGKDVQPSAPKRRRSRPDPLQKGEPDLFAKAAADPMPESRSNQDTGSDAVEQPASQTRVAEVVLPSAPIVSDPSVPPANEMLPPDVATTTENEAQRERRTGSQLRPARPVEMPRVLEKRSPRRLSPRMEAEQSAAQTPAPIVREPIPRETFAPESVAPEPVVRERVASGPVVKEPVGREPAAKESVAKNGAAKANRTSDAKSAGADTTSQKTVDELLVIHVLAPKGMTFVGSQLVDSLRARGLKYGAMNIFHRIDPMTKCRDYSVVNMVEPGSFDLSQLDQFSSPGITFFMQLPGPEDPTASLEDMVGVARSVAQELGADVKDEQMSVLTGQTVAHMRQRISDHARRRLSQRA